MSDTPKQCSDVDVLISACCAGEASASSELRSILRPGIRFLLERRGANPALADGILAQILREVAGGTVIRQSELLRRTRDAVLEAATSSGAAA